MHHPQQWSAQPQLGQADLQQQRQLVKPIPPINNEIVSIRLPLEMSLVDTTNPSTWSGTQGRGLWPAL